MAEFPSKYLLSFVISTVEKLLLLQERADFPPAGNYFSLILWEILSLRFVCLIYLTNIQTG